MWKEIGGAILGGAVNKLFEPKDNSVRNIKLGNSLDMANQKEMFDYRIDAAKEHGLTDYEAFMGPSASGGGGTTGSGNVLGNTQNARQMAQQARTQELTQKALDRNTSLQQTKMQTDAQVKTAEIAAGQAKYNTDSNFIMNSRNLDQKRKEYLEVTVPKAAAQLKLTNAQAEKALNEAITSTPKFVKFMQMLKMGTDNVLATAIQNFKGVNLVDPKSVSKLSIDDKQDIIQQILSIQSGTYKNVQGIKQIAKDWYDKWEIPGLGNNRR